MEMKKYVLEKALVVVLACLMTLPAGIMGIRAKADTISGTVGISPTMLDNAQRIALGSLYSQYPLKPPPSVPDEQIVGYNYIQNGDFAGNMNFWYSQIIPSGAGEVAYDSANSPYSLTGTGSARLQVTTYTNPTSVVLKLMQNIQPFPSEAIKGFSYLKFDYTTGGDDLTINIIGTVNGETKILSVTYPLSPVGWTQKIISATELAKGMVDTSNFIPTKIEFVATGMGPYSSLHIDHVQLVWGEDIGTEGGYIYLPEPINYIWSNPIDTRNTFEYVERQITQNFVNPTTIKT